MIDDPFTAAAGERYDVIVIAVPHDEFRTRALADFLELLRADNGGGVIVDVRGMLDRAAVEAQGVAYWCL
jgi:UDP-N-acetyl-D-mannosaminuronate dehydrogenase